MKVMLIIIGVLAVIGWIASAGSTSSSSLTPSVPFNSPPALTIDVTSCDTSVSGYATAKVTVTARANYSYVGLSGDFTAASGTVIGQGIGNLSNVTAGQFYQTDVIYSLSGASRGGTCHVAVDTAY